MQKLALAFLITLSALVAACASGTATKVDPQANNRNQSKRASMQGAFDNVVVAKDKDKFDAALTLRREYSESAEQIAQLWGIRSSDALVAWAIGMSYAPRMGYDIAGLDEELERAALWFSRALKVASETGHTALAVFRYDYARVLLAQGKASVALEVLANRSEVEPLDAGWEGAYESLLNQIAAKLDR
ncbi:MAG: hypothetical protein KDB07_03645 [Planctomycetes bacterium]|nr:hypothetical protein [Planctomycetota bacterium]